MNDRHKNRSATNRKDLIGKEFGKLTVIKDTEKRKNRRPVYLCLCKCGKEVEVNGKYLLSGDTKSCGCFSKGNAHNRNCVGAITSSFWTHIKQSAKVRGIPFELSREEAWDLWNKQEGKCVLSKIPLSLVVNFRDQYKEQTASLDRIDSNKPYTVDNVQWVHKRINIMKNSMSNSEFIGWCKLVVEI